VNIAVSITHEKALFEAYQDWRRLAELEGDGIRARDWTLVTDCQNRLAALQTRIIRLTHDTREEWRRAGADLAQKENYLRHTVSSLMELEMTNSSALSAAKEVTRGQLHQLDGARQNLKRVERSYSSVGTVGWNSFS
jgi:hypothetical protein